MFEPGTLLAGRYRVERRLGSGGLATVLLATDLRLDRRVAVKRLHLAGDSEEAAERLRREARLGASFDHPNLVAIYDAVAENGLLVVMEWVDGENLAERMRRGALGAEEAISVLTPVADALDYIHGRGVVHRDVKPANVLIDRAGEVKLADLGIASTADVTTITQSGAVLGTPAYVAPEQLEPGSPSAAADRYALALTAWEALAGRRARSGGTALEVMREVLDEPVPVLPAEAGPPAAAEVLRRGLDRDPSQRPATARALIDELAEALGLGDGGARTAPVPPAETRPPRAASPPEPPPSGGREPRSGRRGSRRLLLALAVPLVLAGAILAVALAGSGGGNGPSPRAANRPTVTRTTGTSTRTTRTASTTRPTTAAGPAATPVAAVRSFYVRAVRGDFAGAYALAGPRFRAVFGSEQGLARQLGSLRSITFSRLREISRQGDRAVLAVASTARHTGYVDSCSGTLAAVRAADGTWRAEPNGLSCTRS